MWDGVNVSRVGIGFHGSMSAVTSMAVYNGELYIGGPFIIADGNAGNNICKWDGTTLTEVGGGLSAWPDELKVNNNELYAVGAFSYAGGIYAHQIAKWNGVQWCGLGSTFDNGANTIVFLNNDLYIGGAFQMINSDSLSRIAKWIGGNYTDTCSVPVGISDITGEENGITIYPNPVSDNLTIEIPALTSEKKQLSIYSIMGEEVLKESFSSLKYSVNVSHLSEGIYIVEVRGEKNIARRKFIKE